MVMALFLVTMLVTVPAPTSLLCQARGELYRIALLDGTYQLLCDTLYCVYATSEVFWREQHYWSLGAFYWEDLNAVSARSVTWQPYCQPVGGSLALDPFGMCQAPPWTGWGVSWGCIPSVAFGLLWLAFFLQHVPGKGCQRRVFQDAYDKEMRNQPDQEELLAT
jgi:hypothetical protein